MKLKFLMILSCIVLLTTNNVYAHSHYCHSSCPVYLINKDYIQQEQFFTNCDKHYVLKETIICFYSNGTRRSYTNCTIYNTDGTILETDCLSVKHLAHNNQHYFIIYKNKKYSIIDDKGNYLTTKNYKKMQEIAQNKLLVKLDKKYGVINIDENIIVPIKYKEFEQIEKNLFKTKLNGYYGVIDSSNNILIKNEYDKITPMYETYILKKEGKYGLINKNGQKILEANKDSIKKLGEYILVKKDNKNDVYTANGEKINKESYSKIRLERNNLEAKIDGKWILLEDL